jgi:rubredoxin
MADPVLCPECGCAKHRDVGDGRRVACWRCGEVYDPAEVLAEQEKSKPKRTVRRKQ